MISFACDIGGTFTDLVVATDEKISLFKTPTVAEDPAAGLLAAVDLAAAKAEQTRENFLAVGNTFIHATTRALNAVLTGATVSNGLSDDGRSSRHIALAGGRSFEPL